MQKKILDLKAVYVYSMLPLSLKTFQDIQKEKIFYRNDFLPYLTPKLRGWNLMKSTLYAVISVQDRGVCLCANRFSFKEALLGIFMKTFAKGYRSVHKGIENRDLVTTSDI